MDFGYQSRDIDYIIDWAKLSILYTKGYAHSRFNWRLSFTKIKKWKQQRIKPELLSFFYVKTTLKNVEVWSKSSLLATWKFFNVCNLFSSNKTIVKCLTDVTVPIGGFITVETLKGTLK